MNQEESNTPINNQKILIWMDYSNAIGDFFILLKAIVKLNCTGREFSVLVHHRFKGIIEQLDLKHVTILYKENCLGSHYLKNVENVSDSINKINQEFISKHLTFDQIYYFNGVLLADALTAIRHINYRELIVIDPRIFLRGKNSFFIDRNFAKLSLYYLLHKASFKIKVFRIEKYRDSSLLQIFDQVMQTNNVSVTEFPSTVSDYTLITAGASNATKVLEQGKLISIIDQYASTERKIFVGSDFDKKFIPEIINNQNFSFKLNLSLLELFELVKHAQTVIAYDTGLYHIANFFNKQIYLIINQKDFAYRYMSSYWFGDVQKHQQRLILNKKCFNKA